MGVFSVPIEIGDIDAQRFERVNAVVDTGAIYNVAPASILRRLDVVPLARRKFELADGSSIERDVDPDLDEAQSARCIVPVIFGEENVHPTLGAVALEIFGLGESTRSTTASSPRNRRCEVRASALGSKRQADARAPTPT